jgi:hypothetical protein
MQDWIDIPVYDAAGASTGETVRVRWPPPDVVQRGVTQPDTGAGGLEVLELRRTEELTRFGCGCIREEKLRYVLAS